MMVWMDLEMSGLNPDKDKILEVAVVITDDALKPVGDGMCLVIHQEPSLFDTMDAWNRDHHGKSGLWEQVLTSSLSVGDVEEIVLKFLIKNNISKKLSPLCGNSIWQDRRFIAKYMPNLDEFLHYRNIDVSTVKELVKKWYPAREDLLYHKKGTHRALDDISESIEELHHYQKNIFIGLE